MTRPGHEHLAQAGPARRGALRPGSNLTRTGWGLLLAVSTSAALWALMIAMVAAVVRHHPLA